MRYIEWDFALVRVWELAAIMRNFDISTQVFFVCLFAAAAAAEVAIGRAGFAQFAWSDYVHYCGVDGNLV